MGKTLCQVNDAPTAQLLRDAALAAGMVARIDQTTVGIQVTIDHAEERRTSAEHLASVHGLAVLPTVVGDDDSEGSRLVSLDIASGILAEARGISIATAQAWLQGAAERSGTSVVALAQAIIRDGPNTPT